MKAMKFILVFVLLLGVMNSITITSYTFDKESYSPGDKGVLIVYINLDHALAPSQTLLGFKNVGVEILSDFAVQKSFYIGDSSQSHLQISIPISVSDSTAPGVYAIPIKVYGYADISGSPGKSNDYDSTETTAVIKVVKQPIFSLTLSNSLLSEKTTTTLQICNNGGEARDVELSLSSNFLFSNGKVFVGDIKSNSCLNKSVEIESFTEGKSTMEFSISYKNLIGNSYTSKVSIPVIVDKGSTTLILSHKNAIYSGKESKMFLIIKNNGKDAEDIRIKPLSSVNLVGDSEIIINKLSKGNSIEVYSNVYTELQPGVHSIPFIITWKEDGKEQSETTTIPIKIIAKDGIEVYLEAEPLPLTSGRNATISVVVANKANFDLSSISVSLKSDAFDVLDISDKKFIGSLQSDDFSSEQFRVKIKDLVGVKNASVFVEYKDPSGQINNEILVIPITIHRKPQDLGFVVNLFVGLIIVVVAYLIYKKRLSK